jgi:hypothetical protein
MADETPTPTITDELSKMGKLLAQAIQSAWASEERRKLEAEIVDGLRKFGDEVSAAAKKASDSDTAKQIKTQAEKVATDVQQKDVAGDIRKGMISGLEVINQELGKLVDRLEPKQAPAESAAEPAAEPVVEPAPEPVDEAPAVETPAEPEAPAAA